MNKLYFPVIFTCFLFFVSACKKDNNNGGGITTVTTGTALGSTYGAEPAVPSTAAGALYAINQTVVNGGTTTNTNSTFAWFSSESASLQAGNVTANTDTLVLQTPFSWYEGQGATNLTNSIVWNVAGSGTLAGFTYTDNTPFPVVTGFTLPDSISASSPLTVSFNITNPYDVIVFTLSGGTGVVTQTATSSGSVTFSVAQVDSATVAGDTHVGFQIIPMKTVSTSIGGSTYYFVKQSTSKQFTSTKQ